MATVVMPQQDVSPLASSQINLKVSCSMPGSPTDSGVGSSKCTPTADMVLYPGSECPPAPTGEGDRPAPRVEAAAPATIEHNLSQNSRPSHVVTNGPDEIAPADAWMTWTRGEAVQLRMEATGPRSEKPISLPTLLLNTSRQFPRTTALGTKRTGEWVKWTYTDYYNDVRMAAKAFIHLGLEPYNSVSIIGFNAPEWSIANCAAIFAGGCSTGIYTTNTADACLYVLRDSQTNVAVVENDAQLQKVLSVWPQLPLLKAVVQYTGKLPADRPPNVYLWSELKGLSENVSEDDLERRLRGQAVNQCCTLIYTSGTTGNPKGVMLSHDNITWTARVNSRVARLRPGEETAVSYLPLSHIAAQMFDIYIPMAVGCSIYFAQPDALKGTLTTTLKDVRPTSILGVPRVWEKIAEKMKEIGKNTTGLKRRIAMWAKDIGYRGNISLQSGGSLPFGWTIANALVFKKVRVALGLDRCRICMSGAAPIMKDTLNYFLSLNIVITDSYGMSETSGPHSVSFPWKYRTGSIGVDFPGAMTHLDNVDSDGNGEICMTGRHVFMGYMGNETETRKSLDEEGRLHSGDIGRKDKEHFLYITGRIKEILITAGGENVAPVLIEDVVKEELPCVSNCMLIGDKKKFLSMLITFKTAINLDTMVPQDQLAPAALDWVRSVGSDAKTVSDILDRRDSRVLAALQAGVERANGRAISRAQKIQKWSLLPHDFSVPGGELGPTMKLKRPVVVKMYKKTIDALYDV